MTIISRKCAAIRSERAERLCGFLLELGWRVACSRERLCFAELHHYWGRDLLPVELGALLCLAGGHMVPRRTAGRRRQAHWLEPSCSSALEAPPRCSLFSSMGVPGSRSGDPDSNLATGPGILFSVEVGLSEVETGGVVQPRLPLVALITLLAQRRTSEDNVLAQITSSICGDGGGSRQPLEIEERRDGHRRVVVPLLSATRGAGRFIMPSKRSRSFSKLASVGPSRTRPRGSLILSGSTKRLLTRIS